MSSDLARGAAGRLSVELTKRMDAKSLVRHDRNVYIPRLLARTVAASLLTGAVTSCTSSHPVSEATVQPSSASAPAARSATSEKGPKDDLMAAAAVMSKAGTARITISGGTQGSGVQSWNAPQMILLNMSAPESNGSMLCAEDAVYVAVPATAYGGKHWVRIDENSAPGTAKQADVEKIMLMTILVEVFNPVLELHAVVHDNAITKIGVDRVNDADATRYSARLTVDTLVAQMTSLTDASRDRIRKQLTSYGQTQSVDFWISGRNELVQFGIAGLSSTNHSATTLLTYSDLGAAPAPVAPQASDVVVPGGSAQS
ncbi:hypothetical protein [Kitasatospora paracochleata]|uniref:Lipoprotein n=1 Tax=Kitasatospora paracochleata TaxID=58354 RepID=A0ABT1JA79_9ACTN|nr:hypothetical protein [Kitasatospora paracochleata]MCP2314119.1 hypothetical protein [Kitasatospora paracochleata]